MDLKVPGEVLDFSRSVRQVLRDTASGSREDAVHALELLGYRELGILSEVDDALAASYLASEVGRAGLDIPIAAMLTAVAAGRTGLIQAVDSHKSRPVVVNLLGRDDPVVLIDVAGQARGLAGTVDEQRPRLLAPHAIAAWSVPLNDGEAWADEPRYWCLYTAFAAFRAYGALTGGMEQTLGHVKSRSQFGKRLADFQAVQHRLAETETLRRSLLEVGQYTMARLVGGGAEDPVVDALVLRAHHLECLDRGLGHLHQATGAIGFTDEYALSQITRAVQFDRYVPATLDVTLDKLSQRLEQVEMLFPLAPLPT